MYNILASTNACPILSHHSPINISPDVSRTAFLIRLRASTLTTKRHGIYMPIQRARKYIVMRPI